MDIRSDPSEGAPDSLPYAGLTPDCVLDALSSVGFSGDGRLLALNSYENRVYQVWLDDRSAIAGLPAGASSVVAKFYRPLRWTDEQIGEEHTSELQSPCNLVC